MPRLVVTPAAPRGSYPTLPLAADSADLAFAVAGTYTDGEGWLNTGREILIVRNTAGAPGTVTISSVPHSGVKRSGDITAYSVGAGEFALFGPFDPAGWNQSDGMVYVVGSAATILVAVVSLPSNIFP